jgi:hypothetical protein
MGSAKEHSADEAGGEAVFSSDGLPSLSTPLPPPVVIGSATAATGSSQSEDDNADAVIEESGVGGDVMDVFESFNANTSNRGGGWSGLSKLGDNKDNNLLVEDPRRTLFRLRAEVDRLESSFAAEGQTSTSDSNDEQYQLQQLKSRLETMLGEAASDDVTLDKLLRGRQEDLSRVITNDLQILSREGDLSDGMEKMSIDDEKKKDGKIVYELYSSASGQQQKRSPRVSTLEERLLKLETLLGSNTTITTGDKATSSTTSLLQRLGDIERLTKDMDVKEVDKLAAKAKVIRSDLEAAARARTKLASSSSSSSRVNDEDARTLTALHNHLVELEGISTYLPALTVRLAELSNLHSNAANFGERLDVCEEAVNRSEKLLDSVDASLKKMEEGWKINMEVAESNVKRLDELLNGSS